MAGWLPEPPLQRWQRASLRALVRQRLQLLLAVAGIALGVAVVVAVQLANDSAERAFAFAVDRMTGDATHELRGPPRGIDEALYRELRIAHGLRASAPVIEGFAQRGDDTLRVLGIDPLAGTGAAGDLVEVDGNGLEQLVTRDDTLLLAAPTARRWGVEPGERLAIEIGGVERE